MQESTIDPNNPLETLELVFTPVIIGKGTKFETTYDIGTFSSAKLGRMLSVLTLLAGNLGAKELIQGMMGAGKTEETPEDGEKSDGGLNLLEKILNVATGSVDATQDALYELIGLIVMSEEDLLNLTLTRKNIKAETFRLGAIVMFRASFDELSELVTVGLKSGGSDLISVTLPKLWTFLVSLLTRNRTSTQL